VSEATLSSSHSASLAPLATSPHDPDGAEQERIDLVNAFVERMRTMRKSRGISQRALAKKSGLSPSTIDNTEGARSEPRPCTIVTPVTASVARRASS
jgi:ribosome-binding protein aMBF1 (putative translation factor)